MTNFGFVLFSISLILGATLAGPTNNTENDQPTNSSSHVTPHKHVHSKNHTKHAHAHKDKKRLNATSNLTTDFDEIEDEGWEFENTTYVDTRRILYSRQVPIGKRPYMVYLQLTKESAKAHKYRGWLCGGVIVDPYYVLTSAACVEDADHFYIVSGTTKFVDSFDYKNDDCVCKHRRRVVWKCIPKNYKFDFQDSIKWSSNDIAIVKVDKPFKLGVCEKGCDFATDLICYNNISRELEKPGTKGYIAGWGSGNTFREGVYRRSTPVHIPVNAKCLQEAKVCVMDNEQCAKKWAQRFRNIIEQYMICTKDVMKRLSEICDKKYANCTDMDNRRHLLDVSPVQPSKTFNIDLGRHLRDPNDYTARRMSQGGFCENDHGGPLIVKYQGKERVIGVISACKIDPKTHSCHGPFLYTSVFRNRQFISCAIHKDVEENCRRVFRSGITHEEYSVNWDNVDEDEDNQHKAVSDEKPKKDSDSSSDDDDDDDDKNNKDSLRQLESEKTATEKTKPAVIAADSSSSSSSEEKVTTEKEAETTKKPKSKKKKKSSKKADKKEEDEARKRTKDTPEVGQRAGELFYESSRDDNVNEQEE